MSFENSQILFSRFFNRSKLLCSMGRLKKRTIHCRKACNKPYEIKDAVRYVISSLLHGLGEQVSRTFLLENGILPPSRNIFYKVQKMIKPKIEKCARESCERARKAINFGDSLLHDGAWSNKRNAPHMILTYMSKETKKILDFSIISKYPDSSDMKFDGASNEMESFAHSLLAPKWKNDERIVARVHDQDVNSYKEFVSSFDDVSLPSMLDPGHTKKTFDDYLKKSNLDGIKGDLMQRFKYIVNAEKLSIEQKKKEWLESADVLLETKKGRKKFSTDEFKKELQNFLVSTLYFIEECSCGSTNPCEAWNAFRTRATPKMFNFSFSWRIRTALSIIKWNEQENFWPLMKELFCLSSIPEECEDMLQKDEIRKAKSRDESKTFSARIKRAIRRKIKRKSNKKVKDGHTDASDIKENKERDKGDVFYHRSVVLYPGIADCSPKKYISAVLQFMNRIKDVCPIQVGKPFTDYIDKINQILDNKSEERFVSEDLALRIARLLSVLNYECDDLFTFLNSMINDVYKINTTCKVNVVCNKCNNKFIISEDSTFVEVIETDDIIKSLLNAKCEVTARCPQCKTKINGLFNYCYSAMPYFFVKISKGDEKQTMDCNDFILPENKRYIFTLLTKIHESVEGNYVTTQYIGDGVDAISRGIRKYRNIALNEVSTNPVFAFYLKQRIGFYSIDSSLLQKYDRYLSENKFNPKTPPRNLIIKHDVKNDEDKYENLQKRMKQSCALETMQEPKYPID